MCQRNFTLNQEAAVAAPSESNITRLYPRAVAPERPIEAWWPDWRRVSEPVIDLRERFLGARDALGVFFTVLVLVSFLRWVLP
jgi:hypothetical protein